MTVWIVSFDWRSDDGPMQVGTFPTKDAAWAWLKAQTGFEHSGSCLPVATVVPR